MLPEDEEAAKPENFNTLKAMGRGLENLTYKIQVSTQDCTGCGNCADICPAKTKALYMKPVESQLDKQVENWNYAMTLESKEDVMDKFTVKGSQFIQPLFEFSGACAGCGETPYMKLITQLYGDRMMIANATGCSSIWGGSAPSTPYTKNNKGKGPAWANSLFEDNAEYGLGMKLAVDKVREKLYLLMEELVATGVEAEAFKAWMADYKNAEASKAATLQILPILGTDLGDAKANELLAEIESLKDYLIQKSVWIIGGDGWAYDIGYGGLDHALASGENINVFVFDTEVYSNTGGQASKSTPLAATAKFAAAGMRSRKKDLGLMMTTYGNIYVAQVAMGADKNQTIKALKEAESYDGPSLIIAYAPCIAHGIKEGMGRTQNQEKEAVLSGYWHTWRYDPRLEAEGKNPFRLDSKDPSKSFKDFLRSEVRFTALEKGFPEVAEALFEQAEEQAKSRLASYKRYAAMEY